MADVEIYGAPVSSYVWTARIVCEEKGVEHSLEPLEFKQPSHLALHPWGKMPILRHGDVVLYETAAIAVYLDAIGKGTSLIPEDAAERALVMQWISVVNCYAYKSMISDYVLRYVFPKGEGGKPDGAAIESSLPQLEHDLKVFEAALSERPWLAGERPTLADCFVAPIIAGVAAFPEGKALMEKMPSLARMLGAFSARPSFQKTAPPRG